VPEPDIRNFTFYFNVWRFWVQRLTGHYSIACRKDLLKQIIRRAKIFERSIKALRERPIGWVEAVPESDRSIMTA